MTNDKSPRTKQRGFTFVEVLAALMFLAILIPVIVSALTLSNRASVVSERSVLAGELAENKLNELLLNDAWSTADARGDFGEDRKGYRWELSRELWTSDNMTTLTLDVFFTVQGSEHKIRLSTLVSTTSTQSQAQNRTTTQSPPSS